MEGLGEFMEYICDEICHNRYIAESQEEMNLMCANCEVLERLDNERKDAFLRGVLSSK